MKNRTLSALALAGLISFAACGGAEEEVADETLFEDTTTIAPIVTDTAPFMTDTMPMDTAMADTAAAM